MNAKTTKIAKFLANEIAYAFAVEEIDWIHAMDQMNHRAVSNVVCVKAGVTNADVTAFVDSMDSSVDGPEWEANWDRSNAFGRKVKRRAAELRKAFGICK